jgi:G:T-mismatch repair DNA endonuclease (very short patch repair protein)
MMNNPSSNTDERKCEYCGANKTYSAVTKRGTPYPKWNSNPYKENTWLCGKCYRNLLYHKALPPIQVRKSIRMDRIAKRVCHKCGGKTTTQRSKTSPNDYHIWHRHPEVLSKWLCGRCYANWLFEPTRRFKTREERYQYISKLFSGKGNSQYGNHTLNVGRVYTEERNKKVSEAVKKWAKTHREHYYKIGILGALKARELGLSGIPNGFEIKMEKALRNNKIRYLSQRRYGVGIMDFYLPEGNIALFVDGGVWHADPRSFKPDDILFFGSKINKEEWKNITAKDIWSKDRIHNNYLKRKGYTVIRLWEKEIKCDIDRCIVIVKKRIQAFKNIHDI